MTNYPIGAYGPNPNAGKSPNGASGRGWGEGWPNCQTSKMVKVVSDEGHTVNVRREIGTLVATLFQIQNIRGYDPNPGTLLQTWGFACRAIANTKRASNHSWGLAIDNRATENPYSTTFSSTIPPKVVNDWEVCGFYWGGRYTVKKDTMHFEYIGRPADVAGHLTKARAILKSLMPPTSPSTPPEGKPVTDYTPEQLRAMMYGENAHYAKDFWVAPTGTGTALRKAINNIAAAIVVVNNKVDALSKQMADEDRVDDAVSAAAVADLKKSIEDLEKAVTPEEPLPNP
jgi:hypothetical protein